MSTRSSALSLSLLATLASSEKDDAKEYVFAFVKLLSDYKYDYDDDNDNDEKEERNF